MTDDDRPWAGPRRGARSPAGQPHRARALPGLSVLTALTVLTGLAACAPRLPSAHDLDHLRISLLNVDRRWAQDAAGGDVDRICSYWTDDAVVHAADLPPVEGKQALRAFVERQRATPGFAITWTPERAVVARAADVGWTVGRYEIARPAGDGEVAVSRGTYLSTWRRGPDRRWRCSTEVHCPDGPPASAAPAPATLPATPGDDLAPPPHGAPR